MTNPHTALEDIQRRLEAEPDTQAFRVERADLEAIVKAVAEARNNVLLEAVARLRSVGIPAGCIHPGSFMFGVLECLERIRSLKSKEPEDD